MMKDVNNRFVYVECACYDPSHVFRIELDAASTGSEEEPELAITFQLNPYYGFFKRVKLALRYIFNRPVPTSYGGHWDCVILDKDAVNKLYSMLIAWSALVKIRNKRKIKKALKEKYGDVHSNNTDSNNSE